VNGAYANDPLIGGPIPGQPGLATNRILIRPALYGDFNLDGKVDDTDLAIFSGLGQYNKPSDKFGWLGGDLNHDGKVDDTDLLIFSGAGNYNGPAYGTGPSSAARSASTTPSLTGHVQADGEIILSAATSQGTLGDGILDFLYDPGTGHLKVFYDNDSRITAANPLQVIRFKSAGGRFIPANFNGSGFSNTTTDNSTLNGTILGAGSLPDDYDLGQILATGLTISDLTSDLTLQWNVSGGGLSLKNGDVIVPEPATFGLIGLSAAGLLARRPKKGR
jgi:PEP-CTERM motif